jgi:hypothetical protein
MAVPRRVVESVTWKLWMMLRFGTVDFGALGLWSAERGRRSLVGSATEARSTARFVRAVVGEMK